MSPEQIVAIVPIALWVAALVAAGVAIWLAPRPVKFHLAADELLRYLFIFPLGVQGLWGFFGHVFMPEDSAAAIGWAPSPFQYEVGLANLGLALASFYAAFMGFQARAATAVVAGCFLAGAGVGHVMDIVQGDNLAPGNAGPILVTDFLTPIVILMLLIAFPPRSGGQGRSKEAPASLEARIATAIEEDPPPPPAGGAPAPRIEDELERARKSMRDSLQAPPAPEILPPQRRQAVDRAKGRRGRGKGLSGVREE